jgi:hypothetical protein
MNLQFMAAVARMHAQRRLCAPDEVVDLETDDIELHLGDDGRTIGVLMPDGRGGFLSEAVTLAHPVDPMTTTEGELRRLLDS